MGSPGELAQPAAPVRVVHEVERAALDGRGPAQLLLLGRRDGHLAERVPVRTSPANRGEQAGDLGTDWCGAAAADLGDESGPAAVRKSA
jgi:hypothetical protein